MAASTPELNLAAAPQRSYARVLDAGQSRLVTRRAACSGRRASRGAEHDPAAWRRSGHHRDMGNRLTMQTHGTRQERAFSASRGSCIVLHYKACLFVAQIAVNVRPSTVHHCEARPDRRFSASVTKPTRTGRGVPVCRFCAGRPGQITRAGALPAGIRIRRLRGEGCFPRPVGGQIRVPAAGSGDGAFMRVGWREAVREP